MSTASLRSSLRLTLYPGAGAEGRMSDLPCVSQKLWELAKQVSEFLVWRQVVCPFPRDRRILQFLVTSAVFNEDGEGPAHDITTA